MKIVQFILTLTIFGCVMCKTAPERQSVVDMSAQEMQKEDMNDFSIPLGWVDGNTFRIKSSSTTKDGAIMEAQNAVIERFVVERLKESRKLVDPKSTGVVIVDEFGGVVKAGSVIREKKEDGRFTIIYEVKSDNLKNRVLGKVKK